MTPTPRCRDGEASGRVRIPADVDRPDRLLAGLTARQLAILTTGALVLWAGYTLTRQLLPLAVYAAGAVPLAALCALLALGRMEGVSADRWVLAAVRHRRSARRLVPAPGGIPTPPALLAGAAGPLPAPLRLPLAGISADGIINLGPDGMALVCRASAVTFALRTPGEQEALVAGFARFLNSLSEPVQILLRSAPLNLRPTIDVLIGAAPGLPHVALERAARDHARFLAQLAGSRDLLRREVHLVLRQPHSPDAAARLRRRASEAVGALAAAGVTLHILAGPETAALLGSYLDPAGPAGPAAGSGSGSGSGSGQIDLPVTLASHPTVPVVPVVPGPVGGGRAGQEGASR